MVQMFYCADRFKTKRASKRHDVRARVGFTLVELTVVLVLISIVFVVALPRIPNDILVNPTQKTSRWLLANIQHLKAASARDHTDYALYVDIDNGRLWTSAVSASQAEQEPSKESGLTLSGDNRILDVELAGNRKLGVGTVMIQFYAKGYSDHAMIHLRDADENDWSYHIPPFLPQLKIITGYIDLEG
jgi:prepilin-type N-terminal cleavage/methylation domain-containing protein